MAFKVSRQRDGESNRLFVEIAIGGSKNAGPDVLADKYAHLGEGKNLVNPKDAANVAERIYKKWHLDYSDENKFVRVVNKDNPTLEFDCSAKGFAELQKWADQVIKTMDNCNSCGRVMGAKEPFKLDEIPKKVFCSEICLANIYRHLFGVELPSMSKTKKKKLTI